MMIIAIREEFTTGDRNHRDSSFHFVHAAAHILGSSFTRCAATRNMELFSAEFLSALVAIIIIDLVLAGDNAIVIALAARGLPSHLRKRAISGARSARSPCAPR